MNTTLDLLALGSAWLVMFGLALNAPAALTRSGGWLVAALLGYLLPGLGLLALAGLGAAIDRVANRRLAGLDSHLAGLG